MPRPLYESESDLRRESELAEKVQATWGIELLKLPIHWRIDFIMRNKKGSCIGFCEMKCRNINTTDFDTFIISKTKMDAGIKLVEHLGFLPPLEYRDAERSPVLRTKLYKPIPFLIFVRCKDKDLYYKYDAEHNLAIEKNAGRTKRTRDSKDIETIVHIPWRLFKSWPEKQLAAA